MAASRTIKDIKEHIDIETVMFMKAHGKVM
jgi:hypothetical protein